MIKVILFDLGGVLVKLKNENLFISFLVKNSGLKIIDRNKIISLIDTLNSGKINMHELYYFLSKEYLLNVSYKSFIDNYNKLIIGDDIPGMYDFIIKLKNKYKIALLSNTNSIHFNYIVRTSNILNLFDEFFLSYKLKKLKPDKDIFFYVLNELKVTPDEVLYIDDTIKNIFNAREIGITSIYATKNINSAYLINSKLQSKL